MPHIHTEPNQYDFTVSAYIVRTDHDEPRLILHQHKLLGKWLQFGGHVELHEDPWSAITHEIKEESGYDINQLSLLQPYTRPKSVTDNVLHPQPLALLSHPFEGNPHFHTDISFAFTTNESANHAIETGESSVVESFTIAELLQLSESEIYSNVRDLGVYVLTECLNTYELIDCNTISSR